VIHPQAGRSPQSHTSADVSFPQIAPRTRYFIIVAVRRAIVLVDGSIRAVTSFRAKLESDLRATPDDVATIVENG
jgi:hypothetical protein